MGLEFESRSVCIDLKLRLPLYIYHSAYTGFPGGSDGKESACNVGDLGLIPGLGRSSIPVLTSLVAQMVKHLPTMWETQV